MSEVWLNGRYVAADEARIGIADRGFLLGDGAFETIRAETGRLRRWPRHRARLAGALGVLQIAPPDWVAVESAARRLAREHGEAAVVRITISRGEHGPGMTAPPGEPGTVLVTARAMAPAPRVLNAILVRDLRREPTSLATRFKLTQYADPLHARRQAASVGADMALMLSSSGHLSCADSASLFWIEAGGRVATPGADCAALNGTARGALMLACAEAGITLDEVKAGPDALQRAEAVFITNAVMGVVPVARVDDRSFDADHPMLARLSDMERAAE
ncbi:MAG: 2-keto-4-methylthiobutyrate aminotransferase [Alphaproteobacteria bacterium]|nr:2-keto-4-methylthiobutyrate aminotransferase [Alphaproteobacteria bacterium]